MLEKTFKFLSILFVGYFDLKKFSFEASKIILTNFLENNSFEGLSQWREVLDLMRIAERKHEDWCQTFQSQTLLFDDDLHFLSDERPHRCR